MQVYTCASVGVGVRGRADDGGRGVGVGRLAEGASRPNGDVFAVAMANSSQLTTPNPSIGTESDF